MMLKYILKRILIFFPTIIIISLLAFLLSIYSPGDPNDSNTSSDDNSGKQNSHPENNLKYLKHKAGLDLPVFYFSIHSLAEPDTLYRISDKQEREALERLISEYGNWDQISEFNLALKKLQHEILNYSKQDTITDSLYVPDRLEILNLAKYHSLNIRTFWDSREILGSMNELIFLLTKINAPASIMESLKTCRLKYNLMRNNAMSWKNYIPTISFHGMNQYHRWLFGDGNIFTGEGAINSQGLIRGDFGNSSVTHLPISGVIGAKIKWSLLFTLLSVFFAYLVSIPIGIRSATHPGSTFERTSSTILYILYSMPSFWMATLLLMTFANPDVLKIFKASGVGPIGGFPEGMGLLHKIRLTLPYLVLPTIVYTYSSFAFLSRTVRTSMLEVIQQDYILTARAKGLSENTVIYKHALRNALLPLITVFANIFPAAVGGSVIIESIFSIPGMGAGSYDAIFSKDYNMIIAVFTLTGIFTMVGYLITDVLYTLANPRIRYS